MRPPERVVVTGVGAVSALGLTAHALWEALRDGRDGFGPIDVPDADTLRFTRGAQVRGFDPALHFDAKQLPLLDRFTQLGLVAAREAVVDAGIELTPDLRRRCAVVTGCAGGGVASLGQMYSDLWRDGRHRAPVLTIPRFIPNALASHVCMEIGATGPSFTVSTACASSNHAIGHAFWMVRNRQADLAVTGGSESPFNIGHLKAWEAMRVVAGDTCRPFSKERAGMILGEAGAMLVLEPLSRARARGVRIYAEIIGFGMSADAHHITQPLAEGAARAMTEALLDADVEPASVGYINCHGTGTLANDAMETAAIRSTFGVHANDLAVSSTKSMHGHTLGAAGAIEAVATVQALYFGVLPPTANYATPDPTCDLDVISNVARCAEPDVALSNSFAFGGLNAVLAFRRWQEGQK